MLVAALDARPLIEGDGGKVPCLTGSLAAAVARRHVAMGVAGCPRPSLRTTAQPVRRPPWWPLGPVQTACQSFDREVRPEVTLGFAEREWWREKRDPTLPPTHRPLET